jgi:CHRD domain
MTTTFPRFGLAALACAAALAFASPSLAEMMHFKATANGAQEVPPNNTKGTATVNVTYDTGSMMLTWDGTYSGLSGKATAAHFHKGAPGKNGGVVVPIFAGNTAKSPYKGSKKLTAEQAGDLMAGQWYLNIHTAAHPPGEIRGQLTKQ